MKPPSNTAHDGLANALSVDVEEYFQVSAFESVIDRARWEEWPSRVEHQTHRLLDLFAEHDVRATFFTLGWIAERHPALVRRMAAERHEVGCHGYDHIRVTEQARERFSEELKRSKAILEDTAGARVDGFRAASFSIDSSNWWAFEEIEQAGFRYSTSIYPISHDLYGMPEAPSGPFRPEGTGRLVEIPVSTVPLGSRKIPAGGGGYFRLFPYALTRRLVRHVNHTQGVPANMYFHPWEFDPEQPRPSSLPLKSRFRHYVNQGRAFERLRRLCTDFRWAPFSDVYAKVLSEHV